MSRINKFDIILKKIFFYKNRTMLSWRDILIYGLSKEYPREIVSQIIHFLHREIISQRVEESRNYHVDRMPIVIKEKWHVPHLILPQLILPHLIPINPWIRNHQVDPSQKTHSQLPRQCQTHQVPRRTPLPKP